jgi:hypothetical protein
MQRRPTFPKIGPMKELSSLLRMSDCLERALRADTFAECADDAATRETWLSIAKFWRAQMTGSAA